MCGITGVYFFSKAAEKYHLYVGNAISNLNLRGPDASGKYIHNRVALGHARLSVIDVTEAAAQPFTDASGRYTIVFNGEIFNYKELRLYLEAKGIKFRSQSDTEVLLSLYILEGKNFVHKLNGFFAFAIYDNIEETLCLGRDRFGIKPLYYYHDSDVFVFASEMKALLSYPLAKNIDNNALFFYLQLNYIPAPHSIFKSIRKLEPGHAIYISANSFKTEKYYDLDIDKPSDKILSYGDASKKLAALLDDAVKLRMISDVPLGAFLSGGIDSSVVVALASRHANNLNTFSIGFKDEPLFDETYYANLVSKKFNTSHTVYKLTNQDLFEHLYDVLDYTDEPFADSSALAVYILSKYTRKHVTVALSGDGADEVFGGYNKHYAEFIYQQYPFLWKMLSFSEPLLRSLPQSRNSALLNKFRQLHRMAKGAQMNAKDRYWHWCRYADEKMVQEMMKISCNPDEYNVGKQYYLGQIDNNNGEMNDIFFTDVKFVLPNDMLVKVDMMSMANSLEVRVPFLDYRIVEFVMSLPSDYKIDKSGRKKILRDAFRDELPPELYTRKKHGFEVPLLKWFNTELRSLITDDLLNDQFIKDQNLFDLIEINKLKQQVFSNKPGDATARIWALIVFQYWYKKYMN
ncbi:MAG: Asparagine synthetase (glutamine-hydrolyzing) 1 [Bacteroidetes bacterium ADurb.Bin408]|nr:MAG: Asparagine synthetase (glutamine-hydrolyzing) 1 [Bacteroidetes bacterium ADurb.Bin408]